MGKAGRGVLPVIASRMGGEETGRARGDRAFHWGRKDPREEERERGAGPSWEEKGDGAAAEHFKGMIKGVPHQFLHL